MTSLPANGQKGVAITLPRDLMLYVVALAVVLWPLYALGWENK